MFEEEAEEYADLKCGKDNRKTTGWVLTQEDFQNGAELGYNKAKEDVKHDLMTKLKDVGIVKVLKDSVFSRLSSQEQQELCAWIEYSIEKELEKLNKANEWHYVKDGDFPKEMENVLCYCKGTGIKFCCVGHTIVGGDKKARWWANNKSEELLVIKWKEIILDEEE